VVVSPELPLGLLSAVITHAAGESANPLVPIGTNAVVLAATPAVIQELADKARARGLAHRLITEDSLQDRPVAIGFQPVIRKVVQPIVSSLPLLR
jgi:hypothetical protein